MTPSERALLREMRRGALYRLMVWARRAGRRFVHKGGPRAVALVLLALLSTGAKLRVGIVPDTQNYVSNYAADVPQIDLVAAAIQLAAMADYLCETRPDFVVQVGDLTDSTGGPTGADTDDPDSRTAWGGVNEAEWRRVRVFFDRLDACGVPWFVVTGNHDSSLDFARWFPREDFMGRPWAHAMGTDGEQRAAIFATGLGPICVLGLDFMQTAEDRAWAEAQVGCEADLPTLVVRHASAAIYPFVADRRVFGFVEGHWTSPVGLRTQMISRSAMPGYLTVFANWQEIQYGGARGAGWIAMAEWDTTARTVAVSAWSHVLNSAQPHHAGYTNQGGTFAWDWCAALGCSSPVLPPVLLRQ